MFDLTKWYADAVSADGDYLVGYSAHLRQGRFSVAYSSVLDSNGQRHSLKPSEIIDSANEIRWRAPALNIDVRWTQAAAGIRKTIFQNEEGAVDWDCVLPRGAVEGAGSGPVLGYVECLRLSIPPWRLPIRTLRWGRFLSPRHTLIWIDWDGEFRSRSVYFDGDAVEAVEIGDAALVLGDRTRLALDCRAVIRSGPLGSTVLSRIPGLGRVAPARMFRVRECKWLSHGRLERPGEPPDVAWCIHEVVEWP